MGKSDSKAPLTPQQEMFCLEYLKDLNATLAAIRANYAEKFAASQGCRLRADPRIAARIQKLMDERAKRCKVTQDQVLENVMRIAVKAEDAGEFAAALKGQELAGKHLKIFNERHEHTGADGKPIEFSEHEAAAKLAALLNAARERKDTNPA